LAARILLIAWPIALQIAMIITVIITLSVRRCCAI